jgi:LacI family transcriptional regulator
VTTLKAVAMRAGVSITTASHALNRTRFVRPSTAERVRAAARELGYAPNSVARGLRTGASRTIGVIGPSAGDPFFAEVVVGIEETCYARGYEVYLGFVEYPKEAIIQGAMAAGPNEGAFLHAVLSGRFDAPSPFLEGKPDTLAKEQALFTRLLSREVEGLIVNPVQPDVVVAEALAGVRPRLVLFHRNIPGVDADVFLPDDYSGLASALDQLIRLHHRRIAMVYGYSWESHAVRNRFRAYRDVLTAAGIEPEAALLCNGGYSLEGGANATRKLLALPEPPTAIIYWSDLMAIAGMDAAREIGVSIPDDLSVAGFDDLAISARVRPRLSSIRQEKYETGVAMAQCVIDRIEGRREGPRGQVISPTVFMMRESVGQARS